MKKRWISIAIALVAAGILAATPSSASALGTSPCQSTNPTMSTQSCTDQALQPSPAQGSSSPAPSAVPSASAGVPARPSTAAEEWASEAGRSVGGVSEQVREAYQRPPSLVSSATAVPYAFTWAIGMVIFAVALLVTVGRASRDNPQQRAELKAQAAKLWLYYPVMMFVPMVFKLGVDTMVGMSEGMVSVSGQGFNTFLDSFGAEISKDPLSLVTGGLGGAVVGLLMFLGVLVVMLVWLVEDITAQFGVQLLMLLIPITGALSLFPRAGRRWSARAAGFVLGCLLTPVVTRFTFWVSWMIGADLVTNASANVLHTLLIVIVVLTLITSTPVLLAYVMPMLLPQGSGVYGGGGSVGGQLLEGGRQLSDGVQDLARKFSKGGGGDKAAADQAGADAVSEASAARTGAGAAEAGAGAEAAGAGAAGAGAVAGPVGLAAMLALAAAQKVVGATSAATKNAAAQQLQGGGGATSGGGENVSLPLPRRGTTAPASEAPASEVPAGEGDASSGVAWSDDNSDAVTGSDGWYGADDAGLGGAPDGWGGGFDPRPPQDEGYSTGISEPSAPVEVVQPALVEPVGEYPAGSLGDASPPPHQAVPEDPRPRRAVPGDQHPANVAKSTPPIQGGL